MLFYVYLSLEVFICMVILRHVHFNSAMAENHQQMDECFEKVTSDLEQIQTRLDNEKQVSDSRYENIMSLLKKLEALKEKKPTAIVLTATSPSGISHVFSFVLVSNTLFSSIYSHITSPHGSPIFTHISASHVPPCLIS